MRDKQLDCEFKIYQCDFILASDLFSKFRAVLAFVSEEGWFTWGDANRTLVSVRVLRDLLATVDVEYFEENDPEFFKEVPDFLAVLNRLPDDLYIDFEN